MTLCGNSLSRSLLGVKRTWLVAAHMSAFDPKRTSAHHETAICYLQQGLSNVVSSVDGGTAYVEMIATEGTGVKP
jgi:hypothetical protein